MVTCPIVHRASATVGELREFFRDSHVHAAVLVEHGMLVGVVEPQDLTPKLGDEVPARRVAKLGGRTIRPGASADDALMAMTRDDRRRLAVVGRRGRLLGLLCLKASGYGFCSDADVASRRCAHAASG